MLTTQIQYWTLVESKRHNVETEKLGRDTLAESSRHNRATEDYYNNSLAETARHNRVMEDQGYMNLSISRDKLEIDRYNADTNRINAGSNAVSAAANAANAETNRFNAITGYSLGVEANRIADVNAQTNVRNAATREKEYNVDFMNAQTNSRNAYSNAMNATTNQTNAATNKANLALQEEKFDWQKLYEGYDMALKTFNSLNNAANERVRTATEVYKTLVPKHK